MAHRFTRRVRSVIALTAAGAAVVVGTGIAAAAPSGNSTHKHQPQTIAQVQKELGSLALKNSQLVEQYDRAQTAVKARQAKAAQAAAVAAKAEHAVDTARQQLVSSATAQYEGGAFSSTGALLSSDSGNNYLNQLDALQMISAHDAQVVSYYAAAHRTAQAARAHANALLAAAKQTRDELGREKANVQTQVTKYKKLLATLSYQAREAYLTAANPGVSTAQQTKTFTGVSNISSAAARKAVQFALDQIGKPYVFGAAGPSTYDCSGLTMASWAAAGVSLPHSAAEQYNYGTHVSFNELQPGDLMFFYTPISHVTIYAGDGMMVSAPETGENVTLIPATTFGSDYVGATRLVN